MLPCTRLLVSNLAEAALIVPLWDAVLTAAPLSSPASLRSPPSPPRMSPPPSGRGGSRAPSLASELLGAKKHFLFVIDGGDKDGGFQ